MPNVAREPAPFTPEQVALLLDAARAAPSLHNSQPWRFAVRASRVEVRADPTRALPAVDPDGRQRLISCGAAVFNLRLAMAHLGYAARTTLCPEPADPDHVATVVCTGPHEAGHEERTLYSMIARRRTNRGTYRPEPVPPPVLRELLAAADRESATLRPVATDRRAAVGALIARGIDQQARSPALRREFAHWVSDELEPSAGTPFESWLRAPYPLPALAGHDRLTADEWAAVEALAADSTLLVLCSSADGTADRLRVGQALQRVLLRATASGVAVSFLNQPIEVPTLRLELAALLGTEECPQMLLRAGYSRSTALRTGRRAVEHVVDS
jgi:Nitroreductase family